MRNSLYQKNKRNIEDISFVGKTKEEIKDLLECESNFNHENFWYFVISKTWYGRKKILYLEFEDNIVSHKSVIISHWKNRNNLSIIEKHDNK